MATLSHGCDRAAQALSFLQRLNFSAPANLERAECPSCRKWVRLYCARCVRSVVELPEPLSLTLQVMILRHPKEAAAKSSATPLSLLSPDIQVREWGPHCVDQTWEPGTWLAFPSEDATDASSVDWAEVTGLVLVDSRWKHAKAVVDDPKLQLRTLPAMKLGPESSVRSCFWRSATEKLDLEGLLSTAECLHWLLKLRQRSQGLEVRCSDPVLNAQLYSNRAHAYWRAARASLQLDLCRNGIDFCEAGLEQAPGDADLQKLRAACAEKLAGQQQRRRAQEAAANRDFNADEAMAVQDKVTGLNEQLSRLKSTLSSKQRQRVRLELTQQTIESTPEDAKLYRGIGRCFLLGERQEMLDEMKGTMNNIDEELPKMQKASQELEKRKDDAEKELREMIAAFRQQADRSAATAA
ncbi:unnamed protein product [Durusdinium trenchii]|uniref:tRNA-uridine aminocarboxypropyltransferase 1 n=1 Tax=Durusdinium trenchii TaxID=1381693 RepID=A0ABP0RJB0_9DINO